MAIENGAQSEIDRKDQESAKHSVENRRFWRSNAPQRETSSRRKISKTSLHEGKSMLKHIMRKCKIVNYMDKETSSGTHIPSRRRSLRTTPARLHRTEGRPAAIRVFFDSGFDGAREQACRCPTRGVKLVEVCSASSGKSWDRQLGSLDFTVWRWLRPRTLMALMASERARADWEEKHQPSGKPI